MSNGLLFVASANRCCLVASAPSATLASAVTLLGCDENMASFLWGTMAMDAAKREASAFLDASIKDVAAPPCGVFGEVDAIPSSTAKGMSLDESMSWFPKVVDAADVSYMCDW